MSFFVPKKDAYKNLDGAGAVELDYPTAEDFSVTDAVMPSNGFVSTEGLEGTPYDTAKIQDNALVLTNSEVRFYSSFVDVSSSRFAITFDFRLSSTKSNQALLARTDNSGGNRVFRLVVMYGAANKIQYLVGNSEGYWGENVITLPYNLQANTDYVLTAVNDATLNIRTVWIDGEKMPQSEDAESPKSATSEWAIGNEPPTSGYDFDGIIRSVLVHKGYISHEQIRALHENPYQILKSRRKFFVFSEADGNVEAGISLGALTGAVNTRTSELRGVLGLASEVGLSNTPAADRAASFSLKNNFAVNLIRAKNTEAVAALDTLVSLLSDSNKEAFTGLSLDCSADVSSLRVAAIEAVLQASVSSGVSINTSVDSDVEVAFSLAVLHSLNLQANAKYNPSLVLALRSLVAGGGSSNILREAALGVGLTYNAFSAASVVADVSVNFNTAAGSSAFIDSAAAIAVNALLAVSQGLTATATIDYNPTITLAVKQEVTGSNTADIQAALGLAVSATLNTQAGRDIVTAVSLGLSSGASFASNITTEGAVSLAVDSGVTVNKQALLSAEVSFTADLLLGVARAAVTEAHLDLETSVTLSSNGVNPSVSIKIPGRSQILLTAVDRKLVLTEAEDTIINTTS